jgi:cyclophilin family peptidyl-prolyl cis-trans isomerase
MTRILPALNPTPGFRMSPNALATTRCALLASLTALAACGGGGNDPAPAPAPAPVACTSSPPPAPPVAVSAAPQVTLAITNGAGVAGTVVLTLDRTAAPVTVANFLGYVNSGFYNCTVFHRHSPGFVLQGGGYAAPFVPGGSVPSLKTTLAPIALEVGRGLSNTALTVAMARTGVLDSATSQFFVNLVDNVALDTAGGGYAVFGRITAGSEVITASRSAPCTAWGALGLPAGDCVPSPNIIITAAIQTR